MQKNKALLFLVLAGLFLLNQAAFSQDAGAPDKTSCLEFWLGTWETEWEQTGKPVIKATTIVKQIPGKEAYLVEEKIFSNQGNKLLGKSFTQYSRKTTKCHGGWIHDGEHYWMEGDPNAGGTVYITYFGEIGSPKTGYRMTFSRITKNSLERLWEITKDEGNTWAFVWRMRYTRKK